MRCIRLPTFSSLRLIILLSIALMVFTYFLLINGSYKSEIEKLKSVVMNRDGFINQLAKAGDSKYPVVTNFERKDWHDYKFIAMEANRTGPGEQGKPFELTDPEDIRRNQKLFKIEGLYVIVSDKISVNRSIPDVRIPECKRIKYLKTLPKVSIIVIFHNEYLSLLLRTIHSIYNRTPHELLHEILLVNDASTKKELYEPLQNYVAENFNNCVKIVNLPERKGLIVTRMEGARRATGEVLVFFDSHMEMNVNWLPPLLEPIAINPRTATTPIVDNFKHDTFEYQKIGDGSRGVFDWNFIYHWLPRRPEDKVVPEKPAPLPVMLGCAFAINREYFFGLGAYDEQLLVWNGENYELSFKLWLCGGQLLEVPCSRVAHTFRKHNEYRKKPGIDFVAHNFKRIAEVWLDDYKEILYRGEPERYAKVDAGDLTREKMIRKNLNCKPFQYFLEFIMPDMLERYPIESPGDFAYGVIQSEANRVLCIDTLMKPTGQPLGLYKCSANLTHPGSTQDFKFSWHRHIKKRDKYDNCIDTYQTSLLGCHYAFGHQFWYYDLKSHQLVSPPNNCLSAKLEDNSLEIKACKSDDIHQKWLWGYANITALENWLTFGVKIPK